MDRNNWKICFRPDSRQKNVTTLMDSLKRYRPNSQDGLNEFDRAKVFEEMIFTAATSQLDYEQKIWMKILTIETKPQRPSYPGSLNTQFQVLNQSNQTNSQSQMPKSQQNVIEQVFGQTSDSGSTLQDQNVIDQQNQMHENQRPNTDTLSKSRNANKDWQEEEVSQKIPEPQLSSDTEKPIDRLIKAVNTVQPKALIATVRDIGSVMSLMDQISESEPSDMSLSLNATSRFKSPNLLQTNSALLEEIREINQYLINTVVDISEEDEKGTIVKFTFIAIGFSPSLKSQYDWAQMCSTFSLRLLVPTDYPNRSPVMLDELPPQVSKEHEDLRVMMNMEFRAFLKSLSEPITLGEIAIKWDICARAVISDLSNFSSKQWDYEFVASD